MIRHIIKVPFNSFIDKNLIMTDIIIQQNQLLLFSRFWIRFLSSSFEIPLKSSKRR